MELKVFYAWQSDRDKKVNRYFIQEAAEKALKRITDDASTDFSPVLDHDTKDVPGMPEITTTILKKIEESDIFLADLTFVANTESEDPDGKRKCLPNPNVLFELGYAFRVLGSERIICVMNTAYGDADLQIFDLAHRRWPIRYQLGPEAQANRSGVRNSLSADIERAVRSIVKQGLRTRPEIAQEFDAARDGFNQELKGGTFGNLKTSQGVLGLIIFPEVPVGNIDFERLDKELTQRLSPIGGGSYHSRPYGDYFETWDGRADHTSLISATRLYLSGKILAVSTKFIAPPTGYDFQKPWQINDWMITRTPIEYIFGYLKLMEQIGAAGTYYVGMSLLNLVRCDLLVDLPGVSDSGIPLGDGGILPPPLKIRTSDVGSTWTELAPCLKKTLDYVWQKFGYRKCWSYDGNGNWRGRT